MSDQNDEGEETTDQPRQDVTSDDEDEEDTELSEDKGVKEDMEEEQEKTNAEANGNLDESGSSSEKSEEMKSDSESDEPEDKEEEVKEKERPKKVAKKKPEKVAPKRESPGRSKEHDGLPLLEQPLETSGKRSRKTVERLDVSKSQIEARDHKNVEVAEGRGDKIADCPRIVYFLAHCKVDTAKLLHKVMFDRTGTKFDARRNIRKFSGFPFKKSSEEFKKKLSAMKGNQKQYKISSLKKILEVLDVERSGNREDLIERILNFLLEPKDSGRSLPAKGKGRTRVGSSGRKRRASSSQASSGTDLEEDGDGASSEGEKEDESDGEESDSDAEEEKKKKSAAGKRKRATPRTKKVAKISAAKNTRKPQRTPPPKATNKRKAVAGKAGKSGEQQQKSKAPRVRVEMSDISTSSGSESDDVPLAKKAKPTPPTDAQLKEFVKNFLKTANLEEVTMKSVCKQVYNEYPQFDLTGRKDFIKSTVRAIIT